MIFFLAAIAIAITTETQNQDGNSIPQPLKRKQITNNQLHTKK